MKPKYEEVTNPVRIKEYMSGARVQEIHLDGDKDSKTGCYLEVVLQDGSWLYFDKDGAVLTIPVQGGE